jgi:hypothetical protein
VTARIVVATAIRRKKYDSAASGKREDHSKFKRTWISYYKAEEDASGCYSGRRVHKL